MNDMIKFRFKTRTRSVNGDYRVFGERGSKVYPESEFKPITDKAEWEDGSCVVMYEETDKVYVAAFGMKRGTKDFSNRPIIFSFCQIFDGADKWGQAYTAFKCLISKWSEAEELMRSLIKETPQSEGRGENVSFEQDVFMKWLQEDRGHISKILTVRQNKNVEISSLKEEEEIALRPENNCVMKWEEGTDKFYCFRNKEKKSSSSDIDFSGKYGDRWGNNGSERRNKGIRKGRKIFGRKKIVWLSVAVIVLVFVGGFCVNNSLNKAAYAQAQDTLKKVEQQLKLKNDEIKKIEDEIKSCKNVFCTALDNAMKNSFSDGFDAFADRAKEANSKGLEAKRKLEQARKDKNTLEAKKNNLDQIVNVTKTNRDEVREKTATISEVARNLDVSVENAQKATEVLGDTIKDLGNLPHDTSASSHSTQR